MNGNMHLEGLQLEAVLTAVQKRLEQRKCTLAEDWRSSQIAIRKHNLME